MDGAAVRVAGAVVRRGRGPRPGPVKPASSRPGTAKDRKDKVTLTATTAKPGTDGVAEDHRGGRSG